MKNLSLLTLLAIAASTMVVDGKLHHLRGVKTMEEPIRRLSHSSTSRDTTSSESSSGTSDSVSDEYTSNDGISEEDLNCHFGWGFSPCTSTSGTTSDSSDSEDSDDRRRKLAAKAKAAAAKKE